MDRGEPFGELELEESELRSLKSVASGIDAIVLKNDAGREVDGAVIAEWLGQVQGVEKIQSLAVAPNSCLKDLVVIKVLPGLLNIQVNGLHIQSLEGLEWFRKGRYINIDTGKNRRRNIAKIAQAPIVKLSLQYAGAPDFDAIAQSSTIRHLELSASPQPPFEEWREVPLETLGLSKGRFDELVDTSRIGNLKTLTLINCRSLERLAGDNHTVTWLAIQGCSRLDLRTVATFRSVESLFIVGNSNEFALSSLMGFDQIKTLSLERCRVHVDVTNLMTLMPVLETLYVSGLDKNQALQLSRLNAGVSISTGRETCLNGVCVA